MPPGWDEFYGRLYGSPWQGNGTTEFTLREFGPAGESEVVGYPNAAHPNPYATRVFGEKGEGIIRRAHEAGKPFALFLWTIGVNTQLPEERYADAPLPPWELPPSFLEQDMSDKPRIIRRSGRINTDPAFHEAVRAQQLRQLLTIDDVVADLVGLVDDLGLRDKTWGFYASDNGRFWGEHQLTNKVYAYEESARVPFRMMVPGTVGEVSALTANQDVASTMAAVAAPGSAHPFGGRSLLQLLEGPQPWRSHVLIEHFSGRRYCAFRGHRWKYIQHENGEKELYDLTRDPFELRNTIDSRRALMIAYRDRVRRSGCRPFTPLASCTKTGTSRGDLIRGTPKRDWICAGAGPDRINVRSGRRDVVRCGPGFDRVRAGRTDQLLNCERRL